MLYALFGALLSPIIAAAAMSFRSISLVGTALRLPAPVVRKENGMVHRIARRLGHGELADVPFRKLTAIIRTSVLERVERRLQGLCVPGISVTKVKGYGEYANFFSRDWMVEHARIEIFVRRDRADEIAGAIVDAAQTGLAGDGIVVVLPVEAVYRVRTGELATSDEMGVARHDDTASLRHAESYDSSPPGP